MKIKTVPSSMLERLLSLGNRLPIPIAETFGAMMLARSVEGANNLGIFEYLGTHGPSSLERICAALELDEVITGALLHALASADYVIEERDRFRNTALSQRFLVQGSEWYVGNFVRYNEQQRMIWLGLERLAKKGARHRKQEVIREILEELQSLVPSSEEEIYNVHYGLKNEKIWHNYMYGLRDLANISVPELQLHLRFPKGITRLLDLGGGHGAYSSWMCRRHPGLSATILDLEGAARVGREIVAKEGLSERIEYRLTDLVEAEHFGEAEYDVAFNFNIIHHLTPEQSRALFRKSARALRPGGTLVVWDEFRDDDLKQEPFARFVGVMFLLASGGDTYSFDEVKGWMKEAGFKRIRQQRMQSAPGTAMLWGKKG